ncbi:MAG TPA: NifB/NifX family molybdenum-iron cluster-binding protein [Ignavibacteriaceae bacterium]|nr:NifB/NifX family molybdenum-iron cluster-binding protein [Ignavibacteriaceae bacterium]
MNQRFAVAIEETGGKEIVAEHFGRCSKFNVCELDEGKKIIKNETYFNPLAGEHGGSCQLPGYVKQFNVSTIIAGGMGQKAITNFLENGISVITAPGLLFEDAINQFLQGKLSGYEACAHEHNHHISDN